MSLRNVVNPLFSNNVNPSFPNVVNPLFLNIVNPSLSNVDYPTPKNVVHPTPTNVDVQPSLSNVAQPSLSNVDVHPSLSNVVYPTPENVVVQPSTENGSSNKRKSSYCLPCQVMNEQVLIILSICSIPALSLSYLCSNNYNFTFYVQHKKPCNRQLRSLFLRFISVAIISLRFYLSFLSPCLSLTRLKFKVWLLSFLIHFILRFLSDAIQRLRRVHGSHLERRPQDRVFEGRGRDRLRVRKGPTNQQHRYHGAFISTVLA